MSERGTHEVRSRSNLKRQIDNDKSRHHVMTDEWADEKMTGL